MSDEKKTIILEPLSLNSGTVFILLEDLRKELDINSDSQFRQCLVNLGWTPPEEE
jgi:hypothetical protein